MSLILRKLARNNPRNIVTDAQILVLSCRKLSIVPSLYGKTIHVTNHNNKRNFRQWMLYSKFI